MKSNNNTGKKPLFSKYKLSFESDFRDGPNFGNFNEKGKNYKRIETQEQKKKRVLPARNQSIQFRSLDDPKVIKQMTAEVLAKIYRKSIVKYDNATE